ncbi:MAG: hypothetical protein V4556_00780 [Bacteroidota bacterium]
MKHEVRFLKPENLDIDAIIKKDSILFKANKLDKNKILFIIDALLKARANQRSEMLEKDTPYTNLSSNLLSCVIRDYRRHIDFLLKAEIILTDNHFIRGKKCKGYCFNSPYNGQELVEVHISNHNLRKAIKRQKDLLEEKQKKATWGYNYLTKWWDSDKLQIDLEGALEWIENYEAAKILAINNDDSITTKEPYIENAKNTSIDFRYLVNRISQKKYSYCFSGVGHRFYNPLSNLKKELRDFITYDGVPLVSIDIKNSQPFFSIALMKQSFWEASDQSDKILNLQNLKRKLRGYVVEEGIINSIITLSKCSTTLSSKDFTFTNYINLVTGGEFYEYIEENFKPLYPDRFNNRQNVKREVLRILYSQPNREFVPFYKPCQTFKSLFPKVYELFKLIKSVDYTLLPLLLQRIESFLVIDVVCKQISQLHPEIPLFTIHDSIVTIKGNEALVEQIMSQEIEKYIGYAPRLDTEQLEFLKMAA